jgi:anti-sigma regulatory factor (Ser/Thr protein kinase)
MLIATELVTNGVLHDGGDQVGFRAWRGTDSLSMEVRTIDHPGPPPSQLRDADPVERGRGMLLIDALADDYSIHIAGAERTVVCRLFLGAG